MATNNLKIAMVVISQKDIERGTVNLTDALLFDAVCPKCHNQHTKLKSCRPQRSDIGRIRKAADMVSREQADALERMARDKGMSWTEYCQEMANKYLGAGNEGTV